jgi:hypothetical protein
MMAWLMQLLVRSTSASRRVPRKTWAQSMQSVWHGALAHCMWSMHSAW